MGILSKVPVQNGFVQITYPKLKPKYKELNYYYIETI